MKSDRPDTGAPPRRSAARRARLDFALLSLLAGVLIAVATLLVAELIARSIALSDARSQAAGIAARLAAPLVDDAVRAGDPAATARLTEAMATRMRDGSIRHVKLWDEDGRVIWADQPELVGQVFDLEPNVEALFGTEDQIAEVSDLSREENRAEQAEGELLEVYVGAFDDTGAPLVVEAYLSTEMVDDNASAIVAPFVLLIVGSLLLFLLIVLPFALTLSRRVERAQVERASMMRHALQASELERRRIAEELHHGVVQELAGLGYTLPAITRHLEEGGDPSRARPLVQRATELVQRNIFALRSLMTDIYPPDLRGPGLSHAIHKVVQSEALDAGLPARVEVEEDLDLTSDAATLAYRIVREGVRNVIKHADAHELLVELVSDGPQLTVRVVDDGRGPGDRPGQSPEGHLGLRLLTDAVLAVGGQFDVRANESGGTCLEARFPRALAPS